VRPIGYDEERDQRRAAYADLRGRCGDAYAELREECHPLPDDVPGPVRRSWMP
jgi:hypothetical protein